MRLIKNILTENECYKAGKTIVPKGIMCHSTGANNPNIKRYVQPNILGIGENAYNNHWNKAGVKKCVHAFIGKLANGDIATVQTLPWNHRGWHCGKSGNNTHISFEICEDGLTNKDYFDKVYREAVELTAYLCKLYNLDPMKDGVVICHSEGAKRGIASSHADVMHWFPKHGKSMDTFRADVAKALGVDEQAEPKAGTPFKVRVKATKLNIRSGPGTNYKSNGYAKPGVYTITAVSEGKGASQWYKLRSGAGWISADYAIKML